MSEKKVTPGPEELASFCARCAEDKKAEEVKIINVSDEVYDVMQDVGFTGISEIYKKE